MRFTLVVIVLMLLAGASVAQSSKRKKKPEVQPTPSSVDPAYPQKNYEPRKARRSTRGATYDSEKMFYERMAKLEKTRRKNEKMMETPQYSDPSYFGHKRPPKKRKAGKIKFCKECGIRH
jgi:hypothetical protein